MNVIARPRAGGKTYALIQAWRKAGSPALFVVPYHANKSGLIRSYQLSCEEQSRVIVADYHCLQSYSGRQVFADNADILLQHYLGHSVDVATMNGSPEGVTPAAPPMGYQEGYDAAIKKAKIRCAESKAMGYKEGFEAGRLPPIELL